MFWTKLHHKIYINCIRYCISISLINLGPLITYDKHNRTATLVGITSFGECGKPRIPDYFSKIDHVLEWINRTMHHHQDDYDEEADDDEEEVDGENNASEEVFDDHDGDTVDEDGDEGDDIYEEDTNEYETAEV